MKDQDNKGILLEVGTNEVEFLRFRLGGQFYGINVGKVCQIMLLDKSKVAQLPGQQDGVLGVMTFRDKTISVVDLRTHLGITPESTLDPSRALLLVTEFNQRTTGFVIDAVDRIERCTWNQFEPVTNTVCNRDTGSILGTITLKDGIVIILDIETILAGIDPTTTVEYHQKDIPESSIDRSNISIVYCEDSAIVQKILIKTLEGAGFKKFHTFPSGLDGLNYMKTTSPDEVDIILSDIEMPQMDGLTLCKETRALSGYKDTPFIFFSSMINEQMESKCRSVGGDACFSKPQVQEIVGAIEKLVKR